MPSLLALIAFLALLGCIVLWRKLHDCQRTLAHERVRDPLTGLYNRPHFLDLAQREINRAQRAQHALSMIVLDLDNLREINRRFGLRGGDQALEHVASQVRLAIRDFDLPGRLGNSTLALVLPATSAGGATVVAERIRHRVALTSALIASEPVALSVTAAVVALEQETETLDDLLLFAEATLERAHQTGPNHTVILGEHSVLHELLGDRLAARSEPPVLKPDYPDQQASSGSR